MIDAIGYVAGSLAMITFLPQLIKTARSKRAGDISMLMLLLTLAANILYVVYGALLRLYPIVIMVGIMTFTVVLQIVLTLKYGNDSQSADKLDAGSGK
jgi:MtN3 and saliva related transmembrane protein